MKGLSSFFRVSTVVLSLCVISILGIGIIMPVEVHAFGSLTENGTAAFMGIGTVPQKILHVSGTGPGSVPLFQRNSDSAGFIIERTSTNRWVLGVNESPTLGNGFVLSTIPTGNTSVPRLMITQDGKVGIGTTNPQAKLDVGGSVKISQSINRGATNIPLFRWLPVRVLAVYTGTGSEPVGIAYDGTNMWTANHLGNSVTRITSTGNMTTYSIGAGKAPEGIAFDGTNMWTANYGGNSVSRITPNGIITSYPGTGDKPSGIAFDGTNMWTANGNSNSVTKISPTGVMENYTGTGAAPLAIAFDGVNMWTANYIGDSVSKIAPSGNVTNHYPTGNGPWAIAFDGTNMWTANYEDKSVSKITPDGAVTTVPIGAGPHGIAFDGVNMWTSNWTANSVTRITPDGVTENFTGIGNSPYGVAFDGTNIWTANFSDVSVTKILVITK